MTNTEAVRIAKDAVAGRTLSPAAARILAQAYLDQRELFEKECKDGDRICKALGVPRTETGWMNVGKMLAAIKSAKASTRSEK